MKEQRIKATSVERDVLVRRAVAADRAKKAADEAQNISNEGFTLFCQARGIPDGSQFVGVDGESVVIAVPDNPPNAG